MKKLLSLALLSLTTVSAPSFAAKINLSLTDVLGTPGYEDVYDRGGEAIYFSDNDGQNDSSEFMLRLEGASQLNNSFGLYLYDKSTDTVWNDKFFTIFEASDTPMDFTNILFDFNNNTMTKQTGYRNGWGDEFVEEETEYSADGIKVEGASAFSADGNGMFYEYLATLGMHQLEIGLFLDNGSEKLFSHSDLNVNGEDYLGIFKNGNEMYFAWNDGTNDSSGEYRDLVIKANDVAIVSEPETLVYFSLGLLGLGAVARRRKA